MCRNAVEKAVKQVDKATAMFTKALNEVEHATQVLEVEAQKRRDQIAVLLREVDDIVVEVNRNGGLADKLRDLVR
jgi:hypothetical protein